LPEVDGLYFGGGYPEAFARELSSNTAMLAAVRRFTAGGGLVYAECGGLMYLTDAIRILDGARWPMAAIIPGVAVMSERLQAIGYVEVETRADSILGPAHTRSRGHQFRHSTLEDADSVDRIDRIYNVTPRWGGAPFAEGYRVGNVLASYVHAHWASNPTVAESLIDACMRARASRQPVA
jgi:cobyrinic acid a,c-diamide synthase